MKHKHAKSRLVNRDSNAPECPRCQGYLVLTRMELDVLASAASSWPMGWRCVNCGALMDHQILRNRMRTGGRLARDERRQATRPYRLTA